MGDQLNGGSVDCLDIHSGVIQVKNTNDNDDDDKDTNDDDGDDSHDDGNDSPWYFWFFEHSKNLAV